MVGDPDITMAMKPTIDMPANSTNMVFNKVLMGCVARAQQNATPVLQDPPTVSAPEFEDLDNDWPAMDDYDIIEDVSGDGFLEEELGTPTQCPLSGV